MANRLATRRTFLQFSSTLMGPIHDGRGVEQCGVNSGQQFQVVNTEELVTTLSLAFDSTWEVSVIQPLVLLMMITQP